MRRLDQILASLGYGSRREVRELIDDRRVTIDGATADDSGAKVEATSVRLDGQLLEFPDGLFVLFHKPAGCVCSHDTREGQRIYDLLPPRWLARNPAVTSVGRLDRDTTGLLLLTDDTALVHRLTSPKHHVDKVYEATLDRIPEEGLVEAFATGTLLLEDEDKPCAPARLVLRGGTEIELTLTEGRFHQVKRMFAHFGYEVRRLHRSRFGDFALGDLPPANGARAPVHRHDRAGRMQRHHCDIARTAIERRLSGPLPIHWPAIATLTGRRRRLAPACRRPHQRLTPMRLHRLLAHPFTLIALATTLPAAEPPMNEIIRDDFAFASAQYTTMLERLKGDPLLPRTAAAGKTITVEPEDWTSGFFPGALWFVFEFTGDQQWKAAAENYTNRLERIRHYTGNHDIGFMLGCSYGQGLRLTGRPEYRAILLDGAQALATRYHPETGLIRSWDFGDWKYPVIIDNMMNLELLTWAAREGGDTRLRDIATSHADKTLANHFRPDASCVHVVDYDPVTGTVLKKQTWQGIADDSAWARGQAWALYGYTTMYRETRRPEYLAQAQRVARFILDHPRLPADKIPYWDFDARDIPAAPRDTSAAALIASALIELSGFAEPAPAREYLAVAETQLRALSSPAYRAKVGENGGFLLLHAVGQLPQGREIDAPLAYADYYFLEALLRFRAQPSAAGK